MELYGRLSNMVLFVLVFCVFLIFVKVLVEGIKIIGF